MRALLIFIFAITLANVGCDGRDNVFKTNKEILKKHNLYESFSERITYIPERYSETITDTIMSNGFNVKIKSYTDMDESVLKDFSKNDIHYKNYHRNIKALVSIEKSNRNIVSTLITKQLFLEYDSTLNSVLKNKEIRGVWLDEYASIVQNKIILNVQLREPETNNQINFMLGFDDEGNIFINEDLRKYS